MERFQAKLQFVSVVAEAVLCQILGLCHVFVRDKKFVGVKIGNENKSWGHGRQGAGHKVHGTVKQGEETAVRKMFLSDRGPVLAVCAAGLQPSRQGGSPPGCGRGRAG